MRFLFFFHCVQIRFHEVVTPLKAQVAELSVKKGSLNEELDTHRTQLKALMEVPLTYTQIMDFFFQPLIDAVVTYVKFNNPRVGRCFTSMVDLSLQSYEEERRLRAEVELRCQRLTLELADTKQQIQEGDYRLVNYPNIKRWVCVYNNNSRNLKPNEGEHAVKRYIHM